MSTKQMTMKNYNGEVWETLYPQTLAAQVVEDTTKRFVTDADITLWNSKANGTHTHSMANITGLETALANKAALVHKHPLSDITGIGTAASKNTGTSAGTIPVIESDGKLNATIIPAIAISDTFVVSSQTAMLAADAQVGDVAVRTDVSKSFILKSEPAATLANWQELLTPSDTVSSVAGKTGAVTLTKSDVGLGNVANESKAMILSSAALTGTPTAPTPTATDSSTKVATTAFVKSAVTEVSSSMPKIVVSPTQPATAALGDFWYEVKQ